MSYTKIQHMKFIYLFLFNLLTISTLAQANDYFQQEVNYNIKVSLDDTAHVLAGDIVMASACIYHYTFTAFWRHRPIRPCAREVIEQLGKVGILWFQVCHGGATLQ